MAKNTKPTKKIEVPNTEHSQAQDIALRNYLLVLAGILAVIVIAGGYSIYWLGGRYVHQSNVTKAQDQLLSGLQIKQKNLQELKPNFDAINTKGVNGISDAELILRAVPTTQNYESLIATLEKIGQDSGVKVTDVSQSAATTTPSVVSSSSGLGAASSADNGVKPFIFTVNVEGSYDAILEFLKKTENSARVINFNSMSLNGKTGTISASLTMTTFFKPDANINSTFVQLK